MNKLPEFNKWLNLEKGKAKNMLDQHFDVYYGGAPGTGFEIAIPVMKNYRPRKQVRSIVWVKHNINWQIWHCDDDSCDADDQAEEWWEYAQVAKATTKTVKPNRL